MKHDSAGIDFVDVAVPPSFGNITSISYCFGNSQRGLPLNQAARPYPHLTRGRCMTHIWPVRSSLHATAQREEKTKNYLEFIHCSPWTSLRLPLGPSGSSWFFCPPSSSVN